MFTESSFCVNRTANDDPFRCVSEFMTNEIGCRMPWTPGLGSSSLPLCETDLHYYKLRNFSYTMMKLSGEKISNMTKCPSSCDRNTFEVRPIYTKDNFVNKAILNSTNIPDEVVMANFFYSSTVYDEQEQYLAYDTNTLFSDVGGTLGLLLGHSFLSCYDELKEIAVILYKKLKREK